MEHILQNYSNKQLISSYYTISHNKAKEIILLTHKKDGGIMYVNKEIYQRYNDILKDVSGNLLCLGLGLGLCYHILKGNVNIDFVEKDIELINFLQPITDQWKNVNIINDDAFTHKPTKEYDYIFCDIASKKEEKNKQIAQQKKTL